MTFAIPKLPLRRLSGGSIAFGATYRGQSLWSHLRAFVAPEIAMEEFKRLIKPAYFALQYGRSRETIDGALTEEFGEAGLSLWKSPLMQDMFDARERELARAEEHGGLTCFGEVLSGDPPSILAREMQAIELKLMLPVIELAQQTGEFSVLIWQHDRVSISFRQEKRKELWVERITSSVQQEIDALNIPTTLENEDLVTLNSNFQSNMFIS